MPSSPSQPLQDSVQCMATDFCPIEAAPLFGLPERAAKRWMDGEPLRIVAMSFAGRGGEESGWPKKVAAKSRRLSIEIFMDRRVIASVLVVERELSDEQQNELLRHATRFMAQHHFFRKRRAVHFWAAPRSVRFRTQTPFGFPDAQTQIVSATNISSGGAALVAAGMGWPKKHVPFRPKSRKADRKAERAKRGHFERTTKRVCKGNARGKEKFERIRGQESSFRQMTGRRDHALPSRTLKPELRLGSAEVPSRRCRSWMGRKWEDCRRRSAYLCNRLARWQAENEQAKIQAVKHGLVSIGVAFERWEPKDLPPEFFGQGGWMALLRVLKAKKEGVMLVDAMRFYPKDHVERRPEAAERAAALANKVAASRRRL